MTDNPFETQRMLAPVLLEKESDAETAAREAKETLDRKERARMFDRMVAASSDSIIAAREQGKNVDKALVIAKLYRGAVYVLSTVVLVVLGHSLYRERRFDERLERVENVIRSRP